MALPEVAEAGRLLMAENFSQSVVSRALAKVGRAVDVDRVYIFENSTDGGKLLMNQRYEWSSSLVDAQIDNPQMQGLAYSDIGPDWPATLKQGLTVQELARTTRPSFREIMVEQDIKSLLLCPIMADGQWWGFVGFDDCRRERIWSDEEKQVLSALARVLSGALRHAKLRANLHSARSALQDLNRLGR